MPELKCPECSNDDIWEVDCPECGGQTEILDWPGGMWVSCSDCDGEGVKQGWVECAKCHHIWEME